MEPNPCANIPPIKVLFYQFRGGAKMLSVKDMIGYDVRAEDGDVGKIHDVFFDDATSRVRYVVVDAGGWLSDRNVLLAPAALGELTPAERTITTALNRQQVEDSPPVETDKPVSRQQEEMLHGHYGWTPYWQDAIVPGMAAPYWGAIPVLPETDIENAIEEVVAADERRGGDRNLRSAGEVVGYYVGAADGDIGHVEDLLVRADDWTIRYLVIDTKNWLPGKKVLVAADWLTAVDWHEKEISVDVARERIESGPDYDPDTVLDQDAEQRLYQHYGRDVPRA